MSVQLLFATGNAGKLAELRRLLAIPGRVDVVGLDTLLERPVVVEDGATFEANASKKARVVARASGMLTLADDSGLEVDALGGAPGVRSARFAGEDARDVDNNRLLLERLAGVPRERRTARFRCVLALADPEGPLRSDLHLERGSCEGSIALEARGAQGFGYDPLFVPSGEARTLGELGSELKDRISHRAEATAKMRSFLEEYLAQRQAC